MIDSLFLLILIPASMASAFLFAGMEAGFLALSRLRIRQLARAGKRHAKLLQASLEDPEDFLWTILVGNTLASFTFVCCVVVELHEWLKAERILLLAAFVVVLFLFFCLCELLPKMLFRKFPNRLCMYTSRPYQVIRVVLAPLVFVVAGFADSLLRLTGGRTLTARPFRNREELRLVMRESGHILTQEERSMIERVMDLQDLTVSSVMIPMEKVISVETSTPISEVVDICRQHLLTRLPVWHRQGGVQIVIGILNLKTLLYEWEFKPKDLAGEHLTTALYLDEAMPLDDALRQMQRGGHRIAIVSGANHKDIGIVSLQDILSAIFGNVSL